MSIHPATHIGMVHYTVRDLDRQIAFYQDILGFKLLRRDGDTASLGTAKRELLRLTQSPSAPIARGTTGLYHTAFLVPTKWDLAHLTRQIIDTRTRVQGHSNHGTHLALYLPDPEGNGVELAWDFPKEMWPMKDGMMDLATMPREGVDIEELLTELDRDPSPWPGLADDSTVGHVHLHVSRLDETRTFYHELLGFELTADLAEMGAVFLSAGGYHHHIGTNVWKGVGAVAPPDGAVGLRYFSVVLPDEDELRRVEARVRDAGTHVTPTDGGLLLKDPAKNGVLLTTK